MLQILIKHFGLRIILLVELLKMYLKKHII
nr:MAG TPA: hypothetical protein [Caudoviricetes sp.]